MSRATIYIGEPLNRALEGYENRSERLNTIADRYLACVKAHTPELSQSEWLAVCDALNGVWLREAGYLRSVWAEIADADRLDGLGDKWDIDAQALAERIRDMPIVQVVALIEVVERFWSLTEARQAPDYKAALEVCGAKVRRED